MSFELDTTDVIAVYAAIVSTIGLVLSLLNYRRDRAKIKIKFDADDTDPLKQPCYGVDIVNTGRRTISIDKILLKTVEGKIVTSLATSAGVLNEEWPRVGAKFTKHSNFGKPLSITAIDKTGKRYTKYVLWFPTIARLIYKLRKR